MTLVIILFIVFNYLLIFHQSVALIIGIIGIIGSILSFIYRDEMTEGGGSILMLVFSIIYTVIAVIFL